MRRVGVGVGAMAVGLAAMSLVGMGGASAGSTKVTTGNTFKVYSADGTPVDGEQVTVTRNLNPPGSQVEVSGGCTKTDPDTCNGSGSVVYSRLFAGEPWTADVP